jgi:AraC-like DNA-binding protein
MERLDQPVRDSLSDLLSSVKVHSAVYCVSDLRAPWGFHVADSTVAKFHLVLEGSCRLTLDAGAHTEVGCGDLVLLAGGAGHSVRDQPGSSVRELERILADHPVDDNARLKYGGSGRRTRLVCGGFQLAASASAGLLETLPAVIRINAGDGELDHWLRPLLEMLTDETDQARPGGSAMFAKLADVLVAQAVRSYLLGPEAGERLELTHLRDPAITKAVRLLASRPHETWTVGDLAHSVGMSRTMFSSRFRRLVGDPPMHYLARIRMRRAADYLATTNHNLFAIARRTGYDSEASLSRAFKREFGVSPGDYRRKSATYPIVVDENYVSTVDGQDP